MNQVQVLQNDCHDPTGEIQTGIFQLIFLLNFKESRDEKRFSIEIHLLSIRLNLFSTGFIAGSPQRRCASQLVKVQNPSQRSSQASFNSFSAPWWI